MKILSIIVDELPSECWDCSHFRPADTFFILTSTCRIMNRRVSKQLLFYDKKRPRWCLLVTPAQYAEKGGEE